MPSNLLQLQAHLKMVFNEILKNPAMIDYGKQAGHHIKQEVTNKMSGKYNQSGTMKNLWAREVPIVQPNKTGSKLNIGLGDVEEWNIETLRGPQRATFAVGNINKVVGLRPEPSLPAWIIMEFGRRSGSGAATSGIPKDFQVPYTARDATKKFMFGPSSSYHFRKPVFFMTNDAGVRTHPGIKAGRFFRDGLKQSQEGVYSIMLNGLEASLRDLAAKHGGTVESL